jgi:uncharacterized membrane-anchored protein YitT (DUF2179 family)
MKNYIKRIIYNQLAGKDHTPEDEHQITPFRFAKAFREFKLTVLMQVKSYFLIILGISSAAFGLESFLIPNSFIDGGATGIAMLCSSTTSLPFPVWLTIINIPFIYLAYRIVGSNFAFKTAAAIIVLAIVLSTVPFIEITHDKLLVAVFGGFFLGAGIGLAVRGGSVLDGTEVLALFMSRKLGATLGDIIMIINVLLFAVAALMLSVETALYSMITYLSAYKTVDFVVEGIEEYIGVTIISPHHEEIRMMVIEKLGRGVTVYVGKRGFGKRGEAIDVEIIYTVITRLEISKMKVEIEKLDPHAFVVMSSVKDTKGGLIKKRPLH